MRFGVVLPIQDTQERLDVLLDQLRAEVRAADEAGFDAFFLPEFHQTRADGVISPLLTGAALAEDVAMLSWLTRGRALLDVVDAAWSGEPFDVSGQHGRWRGHVTPAPFGNKRPELVMGADGPRGLAPAGQRADLWLSDGQDLRAEIAGWCADRDGVPGPADAAAGRARARGDADGDRPVRRGGHQADGRNAMTGLSFDLTEEQEQLRQAVRDFAERECRPA
jgi:alkanesulfonate monooxygenase SsuD/methylene tetrahydromethanopterin reductase-like flavin-dependent oxidoreductase (luciferase family)